MKNIRERMQLSKILRNTAGAVAVWAAVFIMSIGVVSSIYMLGGQSNVQSNESNYQAMLGNATRYYAKELVRWQIDRGQGVSAPTSDECAADSPRSCSALNARTAPYTGGKNDRDDSPALRAGRDIIKNLIVASNSSLVYHPNRTDIISDPDSPSGDKQVSGRDYGPNHFCLTEPRITSRNGKRVVSVALGFPQEKDIAGGVPRYCDCGNAYNSDSKKQGIPGVGCQTVLSERLIGYDDPNNAPASKPLNLMFVLDASGQARNSGLGEKIGDALVEVRSVLEGMFAVDFSTSHVGSNLYAQQLVCTNGLCGCGVDGGGHADAPCADGSCGRNPGGERPGGSFRGGNRGGYGDLGFSGCIYSEHNSVRPETPVDRHRTGDGGCDGSTKCGHGKRHPDRHRTYPFEVAYYATPDLACAHKPDTNGRLHLHSNEINYTTWTYRESDIDDAFCNTLNKPRQGCAASKTWEIYTCTGEGPETPVGGGTGTGGGGGGGGGTPPGECPQEKGCGDIGGFFQHRSVEGNAVTKTVQGRSGGSNGLKGQKCKRLVCSVVDNYCDGKGLGEGKANFCDCGGSIQSIKADPNKRHCLNKHNYKRIDWLRSCPHQAVVETARALHDCNYRFRIQKYYTELGGVVDKKLCASAGCIVRSRLVKDPLIKMRIRNVNTREVIEGELKEGAITDVASYQDSDDNTLKNWEMKFPVNKWNWECSEPAGYNHVMTKEQGQNHFTRENKNCVPTGDVDLKAEEYKRVFVPEGCDLKTGENCDIPLGEYEMYVYVDKNENKETPEIERCLVDTDAGKLPSYRHGFNNSSNCNVVDAYDDSGVCPNGICNRYADSNGMCTGQYFPGISQQWRIAQVTRSGAFDDVMAGPHLGSIGIEGLRLTPTQTVQNVQCDLDIQGKGRSTVLAEPFAGKSILSAKQPNEDGRRPELYTETKGKPDVLACKFKLHDLSCTQDVGERTPNLRGHSDRMPNYTSKPVSECGIKEGGWDCAQNMLSRIHKPVVKGGYRIFDNGHEALAACQGLSCTVNAAMQHMNRIEADGVENPSRPIVVSVMGCPQHKCSSEKASNGVKNSVFKDSANPKYKGFNTKWSAYCNNRGTIRVEGSGADARHRLASNSCSSTSGNSYGPDSATTSCLASEGKRVRDNNGIIFPITFCPDNAYGRKLAVDIAGGHDSSIGFVESFGAISTGGSQNADFALAIANLIFTLLLEARPELGMELAQGADVTYEPDSN